jgi:DNA-binding NarL/FixJ family response regulator
MAWRTGRLGEKTMIRILLYSDEPVLAKGFASVLSAEEGLELISIHSNMTELSETLKTASPDILLMDLTASVTFAVLSDLKKTVADCKVVLWVHEISTELAFQAMGLGVRGILRKTLPSDLLVKCLRKVHAGELWFEKALTDSFLSAKRVSLTRREGQLVSLLSQGLKNKEIASTLLISEGTVKVYLSRLFQKVGVKDRFELALYGLKNLTASQGGFERQPGENPLKADVPQLHGLRSLVLERPDPKPPQMAPNFTPVNRFQGLRQNVR